MNEHGQLRPIFYCLLFLCLCVTLAIFKVASSIIIPVVFSILFSFGFLQPVKFLKNKFNIPWILGIILIYLIFLIFFYLMGNILVTGVVSVVQLLPKFEEKLMGTFVLICNELNIKINTDEGIIKNLIGFSSIRNFIGSSAFNISTIVYDFLRSFFMSLLFSVFLLAEFNSTKGKLKMALSSDTKEKIFNATNRIINDVSRYISIKFIVSLVTGILIWLSCKIISLEFAEVFGFLAFVANFIPTFGSIFSCAITILFSLVNFYPGLWQTIFIAFAMISIEFVIGNIIEPKICGQNLDLSPYVILVSLTIWGWIWGLPGMILSVPLMVIVKIICENIPYLKPIAIFIGNKSKE